MSTEAPRLESNPRDVEVPCADCRIVDVTFRFSGRDGRWRCAICLVIGAMRVLNRAGELELPDPPSSGTRRRLGS